jgi:putative Mg2+ transporter-C (MgtC) family protein
MNGWQYITDSILNDDITTVGSIFKMVLSLVLGCIVGFERKRKGQIAGVRTFALISMGATMAMILSIYIPQEYLGLKNGDPGRIAAQVITGIGFLGAGAIIQMKGSVRGLTTAAGIWMVATIGMAVGAGLYIVSIVATLLILFILVSLEKYEHLVNFGWQSKIVRVRVEGIVDSAEEYKRIFKKFNIHVQDTYLKYEYEDNYTIANFVILSKGSTNYGELFNEIHNVHKTLSITLTNEVNI